MPRKYAPNAMQSATRRSLRDARVVVGLSPSFTERGIYSGLPIANLRMKDNRQLDDSNCPSARGKSIRGMRRSYPHRVVALDAPTTPWARRRSHIRVESASTSRSTHIAASRRACPTRRATSSSCRPWDNDGDLNTRNRRYHARGSSVQTRSISRHSHAFSSAWGDCYCK